MTDSYALIDAPVDVPGWAVLRESRRLGYGRDAFRQSVEKLKSGRAHRAAGVIFRRDGDDVRVSVLGIPNHCRISAESETESEYWFTYVAQPRHVEEGEETFSVRIDAAGEVTGHVTAISRPDLAPVRFLQRLAARRYLAGMRP